MTMNVLKYGQYNRMKSKLLFYKNKKKLNEGFYIKQLVFPTYIAAHAKCSSVSGSMVASPGALRLPSRVVGNVASSQPSEA